MFASVLAISMLAILIGFCLIKRPWQKNIAAKKSKSKTSSIKVKNVSSNNNKSIKLSRNDPNGLKENFI